MTDGRHAEVTSMHSTVRLFSVEEAKAAIATFREGNRHLDDRKLARYCAEHLAGRFVVTHQGIAFDTTGKMCDGNTRCHMIVKTGRPLLTMVTYGVPAKQKDDAGNDVEVFTEIDDPMASRKRHQLVEMAIPGVTGSVKRTAIANAMLAGLGSYRASGHDAVDILRSHGDLVGLFLGILYGGTAGVKFHGRAPVAAAFCNAVRLGGYSSGEVQVLAERLRDQAWTGDGDPMKILFLRLIRESSSSGQRGVSVKGQRIYGITVSCIRNGISGTDVRKVEASTVDFARDGYDAQVRAIGRRKNAA